MSEFDDALGGGAAGASDSAGSPPIPPRAASRRSGGSSSAAADNGAESALDELGKMMREAAIAHGRALGEHEADRAGEEGEAREIRVARAMAYAAWEADGKPEGRGAAYRAEFGITGHDVVEADERAPYRGLLGEEKKEKKK